MSSSIAKILKSTDHIQTNHEVALFAIAYIADFDLKISESLAQILIEGIDKHIETFSIKELSYLIVALKSQHNFKENNEFIDKIQKNICEKLARVENGKNLDLAT